MANPVFRDGEAPHKSAARVGLIYRVPDAQFLRDNDMGGTWIVYVSALKAHFERVTGDATTPDDGASVIVTSATGARWKIVQGVAGGVHIDAVGDTAGRDAYDDAEPPFAYYDNEADLLYIKQSASSADWSSGVPIRGSDGAPGPAGAGFSPAGEWDSGTTYAKNDMVWIGARSFVSLVDDNTGNEPPSSDTDDAYWQFVPAAQGAKGDKGDKGDDGNDGAAATIAVGTVTTVGPGDPAAVTNVGTSSAAVLDFEIPQGDDGSDGKSFVWKGAYSGATAYVADDVVRDQGSSWIALQATTGNAPPSLPTTSNSYWELAAEKGADGSGSGDVTAAANIADGALVVGDGGGKGVKAHASGAPGTAAFADTGDFATSTQGGKADTAVQPARTITAGNGLTGGGDLSADRTLAVGAGTGIEVTADAVGLDSATQASLALADTAVQPGDLGTMAAEDAGDYTKTSGFGDAAFKDTGTGSGDVAAGDHGHDNATTSVPGFMSASDKSKLDGIASGATANTGTVTSVGMSVPTGISVSGSPITTSGTFSVAWSAGYQGYTTTEASKLSGIEANADVTDATNVAAAGAAMLAAENQALTGGATVTSKSLGTLTTGTLTLDMGDRPLQHYTNNGAHTLAPGSVNGSCLVDITNGASAAAITTSGWTKVAGDSFTTTNGHKFRCHCSVGNGGSLLIVQALQ